MSPARPAPATAASTRVRRVLLAFASVAGAVSVPDVASYGEGPSREVFWVQAKTARPAATAGQIAEAERRLGVRLPETYVALMTRQNGGYSRYGGLRDPATGRVRAGVLHEGLLPLEDVGTLSYFAEQVDFGDTPGWTAHLKDARRWVAISRYGSDWFLCLDYTASGPRGVPAVVLLDTVDAPREEFRLESFDVFRSRLVYDGSRAGSGHHYGIEAPLSDERSVVQEMGRALSIRLGGGPDQYSWFDIGDVWTPPRHVRPYLILGRNRDRRGVLQLPECPRCEWALRVVGLSLDRQAEFESRLRRIPFPVTLVHRPPPD